MSGADLHPKLFLLLGARGLEVDLTGESLPVERFTLPEVPRAVLATEGLALAAGESTLSTIAPPCP